MIDVTPGVDSYKQASLFSCDARDAGGAVSCDVTGAGGVSCDVTSAERGAL